MARPATYWLWRIHATALAAVVAVCFSASAMAQPCIPLEFQRLTASDAHGSDQFGHAVDMDAAWVVVGASFADAPGVPNSGAVYVFRLDDNDTPQDPSDDVWVDWNVLAAFDAAGDDGFGFSVAIDGDWVVVGARFDDDDGADSGSAYVFRLDDNGTPADPSDDSWESHAKLTAQDASPGDEFGISVGIDDTRIVVGAWRNSAAADLAGAAYVFRRDDNGTPSDPRDDVWSQEAQLLASDAAAIDELGFSAAIDGDWVVAGAPFEDHAGEASGAAYVFRRDDNDTLADPEDDFWVQQSKLTVDNSAPNDTFGSTVSINGPWAVVGAPFFDIPNASNVGAVYVYRRDGDSWTQHLAINAADAFPGDQFGAAVVVEGERLLVGPPAPHDSGNNSGASYVFIRDGETWSSQRRLTASDGAVGDGFGSAVALKGDRAVVGARRHDGPDVDTGAAYIYALDADVDGPVILHAQGMPGQTRPFTGYVDPRAESSDGQNLDLGITAVTLVFSETVLSLDGAEPDADSFVVTSTGGDSPSIDAVDDSANPVIAITLSQPPPLREWTTIRAVVRDGCGNVAVDEGDLGPGVHETDRVDFLFLPADVDQSGQVTPFDLLRFRQMVNGDFDPPRGLVEDFIDADRNEEVTPFDLLRFRQLVLGTPPATEPWAGQSAGHDQP